MNVNDFDFRFTRRLIAQTPLLDRTASRLMVLDQRYGGSRASIIFSILLDELKAGDCLVLNDTRVLPARLMGVKEDTGATIEVLTFEANEEMIEWETLVKPAKRVKLGTIVTFGDGLSESSLYRHFGTWWTHIQIYL